MVVREPIGLDAGWSQALTASHVVEVQLASAGPLIIVTGPFTAMCLPGIVMQPLAPIPLSTRASVIDVGAGSRIVAYFKTSAALASPILPERSTKARSLAQVCLPTTPSSVNPWTRWNSFTASRVIDPILPSRDP